MMLLLLLVLLLLAAKFINILAEEPGVVASWLVPRMRSVGWARRAECCSVQTPHSSPALLVTASREHVRTENGSTIGVGGWLCHSSL